MSHYVFFLNRCEWQDGKCDVSGAFRTDLTDLGVCFTFNHKEPFLTVNESGKKDYDYPNNEKVALECTMFFVPLHIQFLEPL